MSDRSKPPFEPGYTGTRLETAGIVHEGEFHFPPEQERWFINGLRSKGWTVEPPAETKGRTT